MFNSNVRVGFGDMAIYERDKITYWVCSDIREDKVSDSFVFSIYTNLSKVIDVPEEESTYRQAKIIRSKGLKERQLLSMTYGFLLQNENKIILSSSSTARLLKNLYPFESVKEVNIVERDSTIANIRNIIRKHGELGKNSTTKSSSDI